MTALARNARTTAYSFLSCAGFPKLNTVKQESGIPARVLGGVLRMGPLSALAVAAGLTVLFWIGISALPKSAPYVAISAETKYVHYEVTRPALASISFSNAIVTATAPQCQGGIGTNGSMLSGTLVPAAYSHIEYRWADNNVSISILPRRQNSSETGTLILDGSNCAFVGRARLILKQESISTWKSKIVLVFFSARSASSSANRRCWRGSEFTSASIPSASGILRQNERIRSCRATCTAATGARM